MDAKQLKQLRSRLKLSQAALAEKLGITASAVSRLESGENNASKPVAILCQQLVTHHLVVENP